MKVLRLAEVPKEFKWGESSELYEDEVAELEQRGIEEIRYWYDKGSYEGSGQILMLKEGKWYQHNLEHCSRYGPLEKLELNTGFATLEELLATCTEDLRKELKPLVEMKGAA